MTTIVLALRGPVTRSDLSAMCERVRILLEHVEPGTDVCCDVAELGPPDAAALEALARIQLTAKRLGGQVRFRHARPELRRFLAFVGLTAILPCGPPLPGLPVEPRWQAKQREQPRGVQEEGDPGDPVA